MFQLNASVFIREQGFLTVGIRELSFPLMHVLFTSQSTESLCQLACDHSSEITRDYWRFSVIPGDHHHRRIYFAFSSQSNNDQQLTHHF